MGLNDRLREGKETFRSAVRGEGEEARQSREAQREFDPRDAFQESARGAFDLFLPELRRELSELRGSAVGAGRLNTGFLTGDEDRTIQLGLDRLNSFLKTGALQAEGLNLRNIEGRATSQNRFLESLSGQLDRDQAEKDARFGFDDFLGLAFQGAGTAIPFL